MAADGADYRSRRSLLGAASVGGRGVLDDSDVLVVFDWALTQLVDGGMEAMERDRMWAAWLTDYAAAGLPHGTSYSGFGKWLRERLEEAEAVRAVEFLLGYGR